MDTYMYSILRTIKPICLSLVLCGVARQDAINAANARVIDSSMRGSVCSGAKSRSPEAFHCALDLALSFPQS